MQRNPSDLGFVDGDLIPEDDIEGNEVISGPPRDVLKTVADDIIEEEPDLFDDEEENVWGGPEGIEDPQEEAQEAPKTPAQAVTASQVEIAIPSVVGPQSHFTIGDPVGLGNFNNQGRGDTSNIVDIEVHELYVVFKLDTGNALRWHGEFAVIEPSGYKPEGGK